MPGRGIMRAKQRRGGSLGQGTRFYYLGANKMPISKVAGAQGFGKTNPSIGSMKSLGVMKQNRKAGGNNVCIETQARPYYTQKMVIQNASPGIPAGTLIYKNGSTELIGVIKSSTGSTAIVKVDNIVRSNSHIAVTLVKPNEGFPGQSGVITYISPGVQLQYFKNENKNCGCNGPKANCSNCSGRANVFNAITGGAGFSSTNSFTLLTH
jgi:hypothetical protein